MTLGQAMGQLKLLKILRLDGCMKLGAIGTRAAIHSPSRSLQQCQTLQELQLTGCDLLPILSASKHATDTAGVKRLLAGIDAAITPEVKASILSLTAKESEVTILASFLSPSISNRL